MKRSFKIIFCSALTSAFLLVSLPAYAAAKKKGPYRKLDVAECPISKIDFDDGDTFECRGEDIRMLGVDAPEISHPRHGIAKDQEGGRDAAGFTEDAIKKAGRVLIVRSGKDRYGRTLAHVLLDGELLGAKLIKAGLAYESISHFGDNGMPEFALQILEAAKVSPKPSFEEPYKWRKKHQKKS
ncbi:MAG: thermonuclease family protein [bacterium]